MYNNIIMVDPFMSHILSSIIIIDFTLISIMRMLLYTIGGGGGAHVFNYSGSRRLNQ